MAEETVEKNCTVRNKMGVHARPAALIVQTANKFPCDVTLLKDAFPRFPSPTGSGRSWTSTG